MAVPHRLKGRPGNRAVQGRDAGTHLAPAAPPQGETGANGCALERPCQKSACGGPASAYQLRRPATSAEVHLVHVVSAAVVKAGVAPRLHHARLRRLVAMLPGRFPGGAASGLLGRGARLHRRVLRQNHAA